MGGKTDILVIGATGFTGQLVTRRLLNHRDRASFTLALAARSHTKLTALATTLNLNEQVPLLTLDVTNADEVENAVKNAKVVVNTVGPYWLWGTPVVRACAQNGVHYVDITAEIVWVKQMIDQFDTLASQTHSAIVHSCGTDSLPSDLAVYLSVQTLKKHLGPDVRAARSVSAFHVDGGFSGGTLNTLYTVLEKVPRKTVMESLQDHYLSPASGAASPPTKYVYSLPHATPLVSGGFFIMSTMNRGIVHRTRGLLETNPSMQSYQYGPDFQYEEFMIAPNRFVGAIMSVAVFTIGFCLSASSSVRWLFKRFIADKTVGPSEQSMENGSFTTNNVTSSVPSSTNGEAAAQTVIRGTGDPGYMCTSLMLAECAIALLDISKLTPLARQGGVLTPASAFGDVLVTRLAATGRFQIESKMLQT